MTDDGSRTKKLFKKAAWGHKLLSKDEKPAERSQKQLEIDQAVDSFLGPTKRAVPSSQPPDYSSDPFGDQERPNTSGSLARKPVGSPRLSRVDPIRANRPPWQSRKRGLLFVTFTNAAPELIGEGGDEAETPTLEISRTHSLSNESLPEHKYGEDSWEQGPAAHRVPQASAPPPAPQYYTNQESQLPRIAVRGPNNELRPLGTTQDDHRGHDLALAGQDALSHDRKGVRVSVREAQDDPTSYSGRIHAKMRADEGKALYTPPPIEDVTSPVSPSSPVRIWDEAPRSRSDPFPAPSPAGSTTHLDDTLRSLEGTSDYSLRPTPELEERPRSSERERQDYFPQTRPAPAQTSSQQAIPTQLAPPKAVASLRSFSAPPPPDQVLNAGSKFYSLKSAAHAVSDDALRDFGSRVEHYGALFRMSAESARPVAQTTLAEWIRCSAWWFIRGRSELEAAIRARARHGSDPSQRPGHQPSSAQAHVDLGKSWWIDQLVVLDHPELRIYGNGGLSTIISLSRSMGNHTVADLLEHYQAMVASLRSLTMSMKRNNMMPPNAGEAPLPTGLDTSLWIKYPPFTPDVCAVLSGTPRSLTMDAPSTSPNLSRLMPLGDTADHFNYGRMFVQATISAEDEAPTYSFICILSIIRLRLDWYVEASIASQNNLVNVTIQADTKKGPTWDDVRWQIEEDAMEVKLPRGFKLGVRFGHQDFKMLWNIVDYTRKTEKSLQTKADEEELLDVVTKTFQYIDSAPSKIFPSEPSIRARVRLFEKKMVKAEGFGQRRFFRGFRLVVITSPKTKTLSSVSHELGRNAPILLSLLRGQEGDPALMLKLLDSQYKRSMVLTFYDPQERARMQATLTGTAIKSDEFKVASVPLARMSIHPHLPAQDQSSFTSPLSKFEWRSALVINQDPHDPEMEHARTVLSQRLRVCLDSSAGTVTDRINLGEECCVKISGFFSNNPKLGPGELQIGLNVKEQTTLKILRPPQEDMTLSLVDNMVPKEVQEAVAGLFRLLTTTFTTRIYTFPSLNGA